jgi:microcin C transport system permease protein
VDARRDDTLELKPEVPAVAPDVGTPVILPPVEPQDLPPDAAPLEVRRRRFGFLHLSPINERRWRNFKANRRGYWSLLVFLALFVLSLFAEVIANDRPILVRYKGETLFPIVVDYPEEKFGGFLAVTDYKDPVILNEIQAHGWIL